MGRRARQLSGRPPFVRLVSGAQAEGATCGTSARRANCSVMIRRAALTQASARIAASHAARTSCNVVLPRPSGLATPPFAVETKGPVLEQRPFRLNHVSPRNHQERTAVSRFLLSKCMDLSQCADNNDLAVALLLAGVDFDSINERADRVDLRNCLSRKSWRGPSALAFCEPRNSRRWSFAVFKHRREMNMIPTDITIELTLELHSGS